MKDKIFNEKKSVVPSFEFNEDVANVFDDMAKRSIPSYEFVQDLFCEIVSKKYRGGLIVDAGCSTGNLILKMAKRLSRESINILGVDNGKAMIEKCEKKFNLYNYKGLKAKLLDLVVDPLPEAEIIIFNYTLQFIPPAERGEVLKKAYDVLPKGGVLLISEKIKNIGNQKIMTDIYYDLKRKNGYSELEISQKKEALEGTLVPWTLNQNIQALENLGFKEASSIFQWTCFASFMAVK